MNRIISSRRVGPALVPGVLFTLIAGLVCSPASEPRDQVSVWLTTGDRAHLLEPQANVAFAVDGPENPLTVDVDESVTYQTIDGFGTSFSDSAAWLVWTQLNPSQRAEVMTRLFHPRDGIGLSFLRQPLSASDFALRDYTYDDTCCDLSDFSIDHDLAYIIPALQQAKALNPALKIMGSPWSAPAWMKSSNALDGGSLIPEYYDELAEFFVKYVQAYAAHKLPVDFISPNNEPMLEIGYPSMRLDAPSAISLIKNHLGPAFERAKLATKILMWDHNWDNTAYPLQVLNDPEAKKYVAGTAFHCYAGSSSAQTVVHDAHPDKGIWFTECSSGQWSPSFAANLRSDVRGLVIGATRRWAKSVVKWNLALDESYGPTNGGCPNCTGVISINRSNGAVTYTHEYYALGHASKFVVPGGMRIDSTFGGTTIESVAFKNPDGSKALIVVNVGLAERTFKVREAGRAFDYTLPGGAVATFTWPTGKKPAPLRTAMAAPPPVNAPFGGVPWPVPGIVQAENFDLGGEGVAYHDSDGGDNGNSGYRIGEGVDIQTATDAEGGLNIGWTGASEWLKYTVDVATEGKYDLGVRVASNSTGAVSFEVDGVEVTGGMTVPNTGGWQTYQTITRRGIFLSAGRHVLKLAGSSGAPGNINFFSLTPAAPAVNTPFGGGARWAIPGRIQAEDFDTGGTGVAYADVDPSNVGGGYRLDEGVDIQAIVDLGTPGFILGGSRREEWTGYSVEIAEAREYTASARVASLGAGGRFHLEVDSVDVSGPIAVPDTDGWNAFQTVSFPVTLPAGPHLLRLVMDADGATTGSVGNFNYLEFTVGPPAPVVAPPSTPYGGTPVTVPGIVQAEAYDEGGEGVAYHDRTASNDGNAAGNMFRTNEAVDTQACTDTGGGVNVGYTSAREWMKYSVDVAATGTYSIAARVAVQGNGSAGGTFHVEVDGADVTGPMTVPDTGGFQVWRTVSKAGIQLSAGPHVLRLVLDTAGAGSFGNFNYLEIAPAAEPPL